MSEKSGPPQRVLLLGTGSLAENVIFAVSCCVGETFAPPFEYHIAGRSQERADWLAWSAAVRCAALGGTNAFKAHRIDWSHAETIAALLDEVDPSLTIQMSSPQSPWTQSGKDRWSLLVRTGAYGITTPLQSAFLMQTLEAISMTPSSTKLVNACFPDIVNRIAVSLGHNVTCGLGNIAILAAAATQDLFPKHNGNRVQLLGNHRHVSDCITGYFDHSDNPRIWVDGLEIAHKPAPTSHLSLPSSAALNQITGSTVVPLIQALLGHKNSWHGHVPAPAGRPGGYPVVVTSGDVALDLPNGLNEDDAIKWNDQTLRADGVRMVGENIIFEEKAQSVLKPYLPELSQGFNISDLKEVTDRFLKLKATLSEGS